MFNTDIALITLRLCHRTGKVPTALTHIYKQTNKKPQVYTCPSINLLVTNIKSKFNPFGDLHDRNGCCCKNTHQKPIWLQQRWPTRVTQTRPCFFSGCSVLCMYLVFLTELNSIRSHREHQYSQCSPCLKLIKTPHREGQVLPAGEMIKISSSKAPVFWSPILPQPISESQLFFTGHWISLSNFHHKHN